MHISSPTTVVLYNCGSWVSEPKLYARSGIIMITGSVIKAQAANQPIGLEEALTSLGCSWTICSAIVGSRYLPAGEDTKNGHSPLVAVMISACDYRQVGCEATSSSSAWKNPFGELSGCGEYKIVMGRADRLHVHTSDPQCSEIQEPCFDGPFQAEFADY